MMLKDQARREVYILSQKDDHILPALTLLGGFGGGVLQTRNDAVVEAIPWALPKGDKESVQLQVQGDDDDIKGKSKKAGSLYTMVKPLEKKTAAAQEAPLERLHSLRQAASHWQKREAPLCYPVLGGGA